MDLMPSLAIDLPAPANPAPEELEMLCGRIQAGQAKLDRGNVVGALFEYWGALLVTSQSQPQWGSKGLRSSQAGLVLTIGKLALELDNKPELRAVLGAACDDYTPANGLGPAGAELLLALADLEQRGGDWLHAKVCLKVCKNVYEQLRWVGTPAWAVLLTRIGQACHGQQEYGEASNQYESARLVWMKVAIEKQGAGDFNGTVQAYEAAQELCKAMRRLETPDGVELVVKIGTLKQDHGDLSGALVSLEHAQELYSKIGCCDMPEAGALGHRIGEVKFKTNDLVGALAACTAARTVYEKIGLLQPGMKEGEKLLHLLRRIQRAKRP